VKTVSGGKTPIATAAIIKGTDDAKLARSMYARYVGS